MSRPVVFATDFSEYSTAALRYASTLASHADVELHLVHVSEVLPTPDNPTPAYHKPSSIIDAEVAAHQSMEALQPTFPDVRCVRKVLHGDAAKEVIKYADEIDAGVIVIATHGRTKLLKLLMGSVAEEIVRSANCPVIVVKASADKANEAGYRPSAADE